ncbi:MAG: hypothetical protein HYY40_03840 [Bacteroidetes bacterium]|nr:hypothetical protein [Bacteroidota bacterium]
MYRQIIIPENTQLLLQIPEEFVGKQVEVIAFTIKDAESLKKEGDPYSLEKALEFFKAHPISLKNYKFNRERANER